MFKLNFKFFSSPEGSIVRWFLICFMCFTLVFFIALLPLISYSRSVFTELEIKKSTQQMDYGISQLENTVTGIASASQNLSDDIRFLPFHYYEPDYSSITVSVRIQMQRYLNSLFFPLTLVQDCALQFAADSAITPENTILEEEYAYYPNRFQVDELTYEEWEALLRENGTGFLPVHHVTTKGAKYDALIYSIPWTRNAFLYASLNISEIKSALIAGEDLDSYCMTIENSSGDCLYTDLSDSLSDYYSVTQKTALGGLVITVHIPEASLTARMGPLYSFLGLYLAICALGMIITVLIGSHLSSRPLLQIVSLLKGNEAQPMEHAETSGEKQMAPLQYGFRYIQNRVQSYENNLNAYRSIIDTQTKVLQVRFLEKALHGSLATEKDYEQFLSYFPNFPERFCLVLLGLIEQQVEDANIYQDSLSLVQYYLQCSLPHAYHQQLNNSELLVIISDEDFEEYSGTLNHLIENINHEEPGYHAWGMASKFYSHPKSIPSAYWQLQDLYSRISLESLSGLCTVSDYQMPKKPGFQMADTLNIYTAITYGNREIALLKLQSYADSLNANNRPTFEMFRSILLCIKQEYPDLLIDMHVPSYHSHLDMYAALEESISDFCEILQTRKTEAEADSFTRKVKEYIDHHFTEDDLCLTRLVDHFQCSSSKIQKGFSKAFGTPVSVYIEKKRMELANELLLRGEDNVTEIARKCGFANDNTFYKAYRRTFGHAPTSLKQG